MIYPSLAKLILTKRRAAHTTQAAIARSIGVTKQAVQHWEWGEYRPGTRFLPALLAALKITKDEYATAVAQDAVHALGVQTEAR